MSISSISVKAGVLACFVAVSACFLLPSPANAKSDDSKLASYEKKVADTETYGNCSAASQAIARYKSKDCTSQQGSYEAAQKALDNICNMYKDIKSEYKKCTSGGMDKSKEAYQSLQTASKTANTCSSEKSSILKDIDSALDACKSAVKAREKADKAKKKEEEAQKKAEKAAADKKAAVGESAKASYDYEVAVSQCEAGNKNACAQMKSLYEAKQDAEKKAKKAADADKKAKEKADSAADKADDAALKSLVAKSEACPGSSVWNQNLQKCSLFGEAKTEAEETEKITKLGTCTASGATEAKCRSLIKLGYTLEDFEQCGGEAYWDAEKETCSPSKKPSILSADAGDAGSGISDSGGTDETGVDEDVAGSVETAKKEAEAAAKGISARCSGIDKSASLSNGTFGIFDYLACKITTVVADIRAIVYILAGFGMIAFAYGAIIGKINFKQLANIFIGLFILSMTTGFIEAVVFNDGTSHLTYGDYLKDGNHGQFSSVTADCSSNATLCPDTALAEMEDKANNSSWSFKDLKSSIKSAKNAIKTASDTYKTVKNTVDTAVNAAENIGNAIKNGGDITDVVSNIASNVSNVINTTNMAANSLSNAASSITSDIRDMQSSGDQLAYREELEKQYNILKGKCDTGNCSENEKASLAKMAAKVEENKTSTDKWLENDGKGGGATILAGLGKVAEISNQANQVTNNVAKAKNEGEGLAGGALGTILSVGYAATEAYTSGSDALENMQKKDKEGNSTLDFRSQQTRDADNAAQAEAEARKTCSDHGGTWDGKQCNGKNGVVINMTTGAKETKTTDANGNTISTSSSVDANGNKVNTLNKTDKDGKTTESTTVTTDTEGNRVVETTKNGKTDRVVLNQDGTAEVNGMSQAHDDCVGNGTWDEKTKTCKWSEKTQKGCEKLGKKWDPQKGCVAK